MGVNVGVEVGEIHGGHSPDSQLGCLTHVLSFAVKGAGPEDATTIRHLPPDK